MPTEMPGSEELPETLYLPPSRARWIFVVVVSSFIVALNLYGVAAHGMPALGALAVIFGIMAALTGAQLIPGSAGLWLDRQGFTFRLFWYDRRREWKEITPILSSQVGLLQMVGYNRAGDEPNKPREVLPDTYGISANELADLMNHWRDTAIKGG
jgi:hypothetical protein